ncbi:transglycosylase family protein [Conexibacter sp. SYSU D00693]|uniref:transglycosylase family protein n=1 Tax=Conexibacter sp. SYSU D00693 TaxID=2812560 RepID=UPI00196B7711|nr:transglycosylase family protein [Conexibacter sp. SYSU D00693]
MPPAVRSPRLVLLAVLLLGALAAAALTPRLAAGQDEGSLRNRIERSKDREGALAGAAARLGRLERAVAKDVAVLQRRLADVEAELARSRARLARTETAFDEQRDRLARTRKRLGQARGRLAEVLRGRYTTVRPDVVGVVLHAHGFRDLLERFEFLDRVRDANASIVRDVRGARDDAKQRTTALRRLVVRRRAAEQAVQAQRDALARMRTALAARQAALREARAARLAALRATRGDRRRAQRTLDRLLAARARAARATGPGGPWAIPWPIVECESGGQNLPPNFAGASGYYQFMPETWRGLGGSTPHAYQAPKAEQDRLAARLWAGGAGAHNWVCASLVG